MFYIHSFPQCGRRFSSSHNLVTSLLQHYKKSIWSRPSSTVREFPFYSLCLYFTHLFSPLLFILCKWNQVFKNWCVLHSSLKADSFGGVPIPPRPLISQLPYSNNPCLSYIYLSPHTITLFFFWKKGLVKCTNTGRLQWKSRAEKPFPQLCFSKAWNKLDLPETAFCRVTLQTSCFLEPIATPITWARAQHFLNLRLLPDVIQCNHSAVDLVLRISVSKHTILSWCFSYLKELYSACLNKE